MSQVNFVEQFNLFMRYARANKLTSYERIFYLGLFHCANELARQTENFEWPDDYFPVSNVELNGWTAFDERAIRNTRNSLKVKGLLDFQKGDGKKSDPMYRIFYLRKNGYKIAPDVPQDATGSENAGDQKRGEAPTANPQAVTSQPGAKTQAIKEQEERTDCEFAPDCVPDPVGDPVGDPVATDCENAGDHFIINKPKININTNTSSSTYRETETEKEAAASGAKTQAVEESAANPQAVKRPGTDPQPITAAQGTDPEFGRVMGYYMDHFAQFPSALAIAGLKDFAENLSADVVIHAMEIAEAERKSSWSYIRGILNRYQREGLNNMPAVLQSEQQYEDARSRNQARSGGSKRQYTTAAEYQNPCGPVDPKKIQRLVESI